MLCPGTWGVTREGIMAPARCRATCTDSSTLKPIPVLVYGPSPSLEESGGREKSVARDRTKPKTCRYTLPPFPLFQDRVLYVVCSPSVFCFSQADPIRVLVTGAAGQIAYSLLYGIAKGDVFGKDQVNRAAAVIPHSYDSNVMLLSRECSQEETRRCSVLMLLNCTAIKLLGFFFGFSA